MGVHCMMACWVRCAATKPRHHSQIRNRHHHHRPFFVIVTVTSSIHQTPQFPSSSDPTRHQHFRRLVTPACHSDPRHSDASQSDPSGDHPQPAFPSSTTPSSKASDNSISASCASGIMTIDGGAQGAITNGAGRLDHHPCGHRHHHDDHHRHTRHIIIVITIVTTIITVMILPPQRSRSCSQGGQLPQPWHVTWPMLLPLAPCAWWKAWKSEGSAMVSAPSSQASCSVP